MTAYRAPSVFLTAAMLSVAALAAVLSNSSGAQPSASLSSCAQNPGSWTSNGPWDTKQFGKYFISNDNFNGTPNQKIWANSAACFGVSTTSNSERMTVGSYPHVVRGWMQNDADMRNNSSHGSLDWTTKSGLGIPVTGLHKAQVHWAFESADAPGSRWNGLIDVYFHKTANPAPSEFPPALDLQILQSVADQVINDTTYYAIVAKKDHATTITIGERHYLVFIDDGGGASFHQPGGHTIALFNLPTALTSNDNTARWGVSDTLTDVAAVVKYFMQAAPRDDAGRALLNAAGEPVTSPLIPPNLYLTAINAGWEIDVGTQFNNLAFCVAMQNEPDCL